MTKSLLCFLLMAFVSVADDGLLIHYPAEGTLTLADGAAASIYRGTATSLRFVEGREGQGVQPPPGNSLSIPVPNLNLAEGTLSFWFRPDWSDPCYQHSILAELLVGDAWQLRWRYGYSHIPTGCYVTLDTGPTWTGSPVSGSFYSPSHNLFSGGEWRHYALRWSAERAEIEMVVDGDTSGRRRGRYACDLKEPKAAILLLNGEVNGAYDEIRIYDRWLDDTALIESAGVTRVMSYLQEQQPPPGAPRAGSIGRQVSFVEPATGELVTTTATETSGIYKPAEMPDLTVTPHTRWARPLAGEPVKALLVMPGAFYNELRTQLREGIELWQRLDMLCHISDRLSPEIEATDYDVIVVSHQGHAGVWQGWTSLEEPLREWILERVRSGKSGLVLSYPMNLDGPINALLRNRQPADELLRGFPVTAMHKVVSGRYDPVYELTDDWFESAENLSKQVVEVYQNETVRVVKLNYVMGPGWGLHTALTPDTAINSAATLAQYDYWQALAARAVLLAAGREAGGRIDSLQLEAQGWTATLTGGSHLWYRARDLWGRVHTEGEVAVNGASVTLPAVPVPPGAIVDLILKDESGGVLDWFSQVVPAVAGVKIDGIVLDKETHIAGEPITGMLQLTLPETGAYRLEVYLADHEGRRLVRAEQPIAGGTVEAPFSIVLPSSSDSLLMRLDAVLWEGDRIIGERSADCPVPRESKEGFYAGMSGALHNRAPNRLMRRIFRDQYGVNLMQHGAKHTYALPARDNFAHYTYVSHLGYPRDEESFKPWIETWDDFFPAHLGVEPEKLLVHRPLFHSLGEEHYMLLSGSRHPEALARFQDYLRQRYESLAHLNEVWSANFGSWEEVPMLKPEIIDVMKMDFGVQAFESRRFMEHLFAQKHADLASWIRAGNPEAEVGIHVGWDLWMARGYDYWLLSRGMESMIGYGGVQNQYLRSFFKNYYGSWWHYGLGDLNNCRWHPWYMVLSGARGFMWYTMTPQLWGATTGDMQPSSDWKAAAPEYQAAARAGDLLARTSYVQDQVAIHYSQDSMHAGMGPGLSWLHNNIVNLLFDGGVPFHFVSYEELTDGGAAGVPLLILPGSISLSPGEVAAIRTYVSEGGTIWADRLPGSFDHFGRKLPESQLSDLFADPREQPLADGRIMRISHNGRVILAPLDNYAYSRNVGRHQPSQALLAEIVDIAGVKRVAQVVDAEGQPANAIWLAGYRQGGQRYLVATKDYQVVDRSPATVDIVLGEPAHVYESHGGRYLGLTSRFRETLEATRGKLYALLPYRVQSLDVRVSNGLPTIQRGGDLRLDVRLLVDGVIGAEDLHLLRVSVTGPDGQEVTALRRLASMFGGGGQVLLPIAWNDPAGEYIIQVRDTATGLERGIPFTLDQIR